MMLAFVVVGADWARGVALVLCVVCMAGFPVPMMADRRAARAWLLVASAEAYIASSAWTVMAHWSEPELPWYRTPLVIAGGLLGVLYLWRFRQASKRGQHLVDNLNRQ